MKKSLIIVALCAIGALCAICASGCINVKDYGEPVTKNYAISGPFTGLDISHAFKVTVSDEVTDVVVTVAEQAHERVIVTVKDGILKIGFKTPVSLNKSATAVIPTYMALTSLELSGASSFDGDMWGANKLTVEVSGASHYKGNMDAENIDFEISGASSATVTGKCPGTMAIEINGASHLKAAELEAGSIIGDINGASSANVTCSKLLKVEVSGASHLTYGAVEGTDPSVDCHTSGASSVKAR